MRGRKLGNTGIYLTRFSWDLETDENGVRLDLLKKTGSNWTITRLDENPGFPYQILYMSKMELKEQILTFSDSVLPCVPFLSIDEYREFIASEDFFIIEEKFRSSRCKHLGFFSNEPQTILEGLKLDIWDFVVLPFNVLLTHLDEAISEIGKKNIGCV